MVALAALAALAVAAGLDFYRGWGARLLQASQIALALAVIAGILVYREPVPTLLWAGVAFAIFSLAHFAQRFIRVPLVGGVDAWAAASWMALTAGGGRELALGLFALLALFFGLASLRGLRPRAVRLLPLMFAAGIAPALVGVLRATST